MRDEVFKAISEADSIALKLLLEQDASFASSRSNDGMSAILFSLYIGKPELTTIILEYDPDLDIYDLSALGGAGQISALLATEPKAVHEYSGDGFTALHVACYFGHADVAKLLLDNDAEIDKVAMNGSDLTPLQSAVSNCNVEVVKVLLGFKPDVNIRMLGGFTPLMTATAMQDDEVIDLLISHGADKTLKADDGRVAADFANLSGNK
ncbi:MAG: ankyrin repeat domain-containing protein [Emcibacteraceae bacterium]|nr:ankyrin repeat domain-containing protein [Emcibacteraceae bacterium]MDG1708685.1 ankyrin repeat domain-containing protein [Emcibacteraceae bacterium]MDG1995744.1 ankyrin repeat domain-containing protein [Emcibacteraceae bacterium]